MKRFILTIVVVCLSLSVAEQASAFYAAHLGRFVSRDPAGKMGRFGGGMSLDSGAATGIVDRDEFDPFAPYDDGMNLYQYAGSAPTVYADPSGLAMSNPRPKPSPPIPKGTCRENGKIVNQVPIWVCDVPLGSDDGTRLGPLKHSYIVCEDPVKNPKTCEKYGFHPLPFGPDGGWDGEWDQGGFQSVGPGYVNQEIDRDPNHPNAKCTKRMVCPREKKAKCKTGTWKPGGGWADRYHMCGPGLNCQEWAHETQ